MWHLLFMAEIPFPFLSASSLYPLQSTCEHLLNRASHPSAQSPCCVYVQMRCHNTARRGCFSTWPPPPRGPPGVPSYGLSLQHSSSLFLNHSSIPTTALPQTSSPLITELKILPRKELSPPLKMETTVCALPFPRNCRAGSADAHGSSRCLSLCWSALGDAFIKAV